MYPQIFVDINELLSPIALSTFEIFLGIGIVLLFMLVIKILEKENKYSRERTNKLIILLAISLGISYLAAMFFDALFHFLDDGVFEGGITFIAGMLTGVGCFMLLIHLFMKEERGNNLNIMNLIIPSIPLAHAFGRLGCFSVGCCYGKETDSIFGVLFPAGTNPHSDGIREHIHPTQLYEAFFLLLLFLVLRRFTKIKEYSFGIYLISYGVFRLILEAFFRGDSRGKLFGMDPSFLLSIVIILMGTFIVSYTLIKNKKVGEVNESLLSNDPNLQDNLKELKYNYKDISLVLKSNSGVFSKNNIDFGTRVMLETLELDFKNKKVLDLGCGYGVIGLAIAKANPSSTVEMADVNPRAVELARNNGVNNKIHNARVFESNLYENIDTNYDYIISNPPIRAGKKVVFGVVEDGYKHLNVGGSIFVVIQKKQGALSLQKRMEEVFGNTTILAKEKGYFIIEAKKN